MTREPVNYKITTKIKSIDSIKVGKYYQFFDWCYQYCGRLEPYPDAYAFTTPIGMHFITKKTMEDLIATGKIFRCKILGIISQN